jgi:hypothetical protein
MFTLVQIKRGLLASSVCAFAALTGSAQAADYHFDFSQADSLTRYAGVSFSNAINADIYDANFNIIGQHWITDTDADTPAVGLEAMSAFGYQGSAAKGVTGLQALWQPVLMSFASPISISSFSLKQDDSSFGFPGHTQIRFLDANGQQIGSEIDYLQSDTVNISSAMTRTGVSSIMLASGKFYTNIDVISAVPEAETYAMLLAGLAVLAVVGRRRAA